MMKTLILSAGLTLAVAGAAAAQSTPQNAPQNAPIAGKLDRDGDRRVSLAEMQAKAAERFARLDANGDGRLTRDERKAGRQAARADRVRSRTERLNAVFARRDADRDGYLGQAEAPRRLQPNFARFDADRDGRLTAAELQAGRQAMAAERRAGGKARAEGRTGADVDRDGVVTRAEMDAQVRARFARLDVDRDGFVTRDERRAGRAGRRG